MTARTDLQVCYEWSLASAQAQGMGLMLMTTRQAFVLWDARKAASYKRVGPELPCLDSVHKELGNRLLCASLWVRLRLLHKDIPPDLLQDLRRAAYD